MKILVVAPNWIGDIVMAQTLFSHLISRYGDDTIIDIIAPKWSGLVASRMREVRRIFVLDVKHGELGLKKRYRLGVALRDEHYDRAIVMPITLKSALVPFFAKVPIRSGFVGEMRFGLINDLRKLDKQKMLRMIDRYLALGNAESYAENPSLLVSVDNQIKLIKQHNLNTEKQIIAFFVGAEYGEAKRWRGFKNLAKLLAKDNYQIWVIGSEKERKLGDEIVESNKAAINLCGQTTIIDAIDLIALAKTAITNDSGLMHIAAALDISIVAIYGSSTPSYTPPLTDKKHIVSLNLPCSPCFKKTCPLGHTNCLNYITPEMVYQCITNIAVEHAA
ncbi:lipopolysaccharide heptosyltransferase II [Campylobacterota bacterium]|nr:lipopolysaccharide heptosyltransferase II [Campylobacterota bacterium]